MLAAFLALAAVGACSSGGQQASDPTTLAQYTPQTTAQASGAPPSASSEGSTTDTPSGADATATSSSTSITTEELSRPDISYTITSLPSDLTPEQIAVARDFAYYDHVTWGTVRTMNGMDEAQIVLTGQALESYTNTYNHLKAAGEHYEGTYIVDITHVEVSAETSTAIVGTCSDKTQTRKVSADGEDVSNPNDHGRYAETIEMTKEGDRWIVAIARQEGLGSC
ncbi:hypothetical protein [Actinomyces capricornis]|uniref:Lipoprotein n=1 Tax=Actinomyces capricornis TaxID=2755559 RepID=A0ABN6K671_9ACTO|nr:hypothetical protein [Actinomyces capricornis]BDA65000.1 hypothetical protein MANAM107_18340 [Actinomyces capricornis]